MDRTTTRELPDPAGALLIPFDPAAARPNRLKTNIDDLEAAIRRRHQQQAEEVVDSAWNDGHQAGVQTGYVKGWRLGLLDGMLAGALLAAIVAWVLLEVVTPARLQGLLP